jgi:hypothetical protein
MASAKLSLSLLNEQFKNVKEKVIEHEDRIDETDKKCALHDINNANMCNSIDNLKSGIKELKSGQVWTTGLVIFSILIPIALYVLQLVIK